MKKFIAILIAIAIATPQSAYALRPMAMKHQDATTTTTITSTPLMDIIARVLAENKNFLDKIFSSRNRIASRVAYRILDADIDEKNLLEQELANRACEIELGIRNEQNKIDEIILLAHRQVVKYESKRSFLTKGGIFVAGTALSPWLTQMKQTGEVIVTARPRISPTPLKDFNALSRLHWERGVATNDEEQYRFALSSHAWSKGRKQCWKKELSDKPLVSRLRQMGDDASQTLQAIRVEHGAVEGFYEYLARDLDVDDYGLGMSKRMLAGEIEHWRRKYERILPLWKDLSIARTASIDICELIWRLSAEYGIKKAESWIRKLEILCHDCAIQGRPELVRSIRAITYEELGKTEERRLPNLDIRMLTRFKSLLDSMGEADLLNITQGSAQKLLPKQVPIETFLQSAEGRDRLSAMLTMKNTSAAIDQAA